MFSSWIYSFIHCSKICGSTCIFFFFYHFPGIKLFIIIIILCFVTFFKENGPFSIFYIVFQVFMHFFFFFFFFFVVSFVTSFKKVSIHTSSCLMMMGVA